jgi:hypothetical protein
MAVKVESFQGRRVGRKCLRLGTLGLIDRSFLGLFLWAIVWDLRAAIGVAFVLRWTGASSPAKSIVISEAEGQRGRSVEINYDRMLHERIRSAKLGCSFAKTLISSKVVTGGVLFGCCGSKDFR